MSPILDPRLKGPHDGRLSITEASFKLYVLPSTPNPDWRILLPTIYEAIKKDHDEHRELLAEIADDSKDVADRRQAWDRFYHDVKAHAAAEEEAFYSKLIT